MIRGIIIVSLVAVSLLLPQWSQAGGARIMANDLAAVEGKDMDDPAFISLLSKLPKITRGDDGDDPYYILEGDLRLTARQVWARLRGTTASNGEQPVSANSELNVMFRNNVGEKWPIGQRALTFAIDKKSFSSVQDYRLVVRNFQLAIPAWTDSCECGLSVRHRQEYDSNPSLDKVTFIVKFDPMAFDFYAAAFFPGDPKDTRYIVIGAPYFFEQIDYDRVGIIRHEMGHVFGYRHAHIGGVPGCELVDEADAEWRPIGKYDRTSVMHYLCGKGGTASFELSEQDKRDHKKFYNQ